MDEACRTNNVIRNGYKILVGKPEVKRLFGRPRRRWEGGLDSSGSGFGPLEGSREHSNGPCGFIKDGKFPD
jgi:hypothetical protein